MNTNSCKCKLVKHSSSFLYFEAKGSSEFKLLSGKEDVGKQSKKNPNSPWPVRKGGIILSVYKHSLSL